jgi:hypothetical protein
LGSGSPLLHYRGFGFNNPENQKPGKGVEVVMNKGIGIEKKWIYG